MIDKNHLRETMLALTGAELTQASDDYERFLAAAQLDQFEPPDNAEMSQAKAAGDLAVAFDGREHEVEAKLRVLRSLDFGAKTHVEPGAAVRVGSRYLVIAVATAEFVCGGETCIGISPAAPIYDAIGGKTEGDMLEFNGRKLRIAQVF